MLFSRLAISLIFAGAVAVGTAVGTGINLHTERYTIDDDGFNTFGFDRDFYNTRFEALDDNIKILTERKSALLEQCDKLFEQINQLQAQMIVIDF